MELTDQPLGQFLIVTAFSVAWSLLTAALVTDYRSMLTRYAERCWRSYQSPWSRKAFLWTRSARRFYEDESRVRRLFRAVAAIGLGVGVVILVVEIAALVSGHVV